MLKIAVLVSGGGTNLQSIIDNINSGYLDNCKIEIVISNKKDAYALVRAKENDIQNVCISNKEFKDVDEYGHEMIKEIDSRSVDLVVLSGFNCILGKPFVEHYENRIINVHPSLIPSFCGKGFYGLTPHKKAIEYGVKLTGATVHLVEYETDAGPIILQESVSINDDDTPESLQKKVMKEVEWVILPKAIKLFADKKINIDGRKVTFRY